MRRRTFAAGMTLAVLAGPALAQAPRRDEPANYPRLRAALHELRDAQGELKGSRDRWAPGHRERAVGALDDAINSIKGILAVRDVENFRGVERGPEFYKQFRDFPRLRAALGDLREARDELRAATSDFRGLKERGLEDIDVAVGEIVALTRDRPRPR